MYLVNVLIQLIIALSLYNVWLLRFNQQTSWRGGEAKSMREEFEFYGLPYWFMLGIGTFKVVLATFLIVGIWIPSLVKPAALGLVCLMLGAVLMHFKVKDAPRKALPAFTLLVLSLIILLQ